MSRILVVNSTKFKMNRAWLLKLWKDLCELLQKSSKLNRRQKESLSQELVLVSFAGSEGALGELVFCVTKLKSQARENQHSWQAEFSYLLIHGVLHLLGFEHEGKGPEARKKAQLMLKFQDVLFDRIREKYDF
jgi:probable rRNA maturation factor